MFPAIIFDFGRVLFWLGVLNPMIRNEAACALVLCVLAVLTRRMRWFATVEKHWSRFARRPISPLVAIFFLPIALRAVLLISYPAPAPFLHDEFGNLLLADTFSHGRIANPTHPFWIHFETFHELQQPLYYSFRPPAPGLFLAALKPLTGSMWGAVCISMGLMCAAILWMLRGWLPPGWALLGAVVATLQIGVLSYWMNSYWGGEWSAFGGALLLGGLGRLLVRSPRKRDALWMAIGAGLIVNTRPFEGGAVALAAGAILLVRWIQFPGPRRRVLLRTMAPAGMACGLIVAAMLYYNFRLTGNAFELPYQLGVQTYNWAPGLAWQSPGPRKHYNHEVMRLCFEGWEITEFRKWKATPLSQTLADRLALAWQFFVRPGLTLALLALPWVAFRDRRIRPLLSICLTMIPVTLASVWYNPHYIAPVTAAFYAILMQGMRHMRAWSRRGGLYWSAIARVIPLCCVFTFGAGMAQDFTSKQVVDIRGWYGRFTELREREEVISRVQAMGGEHLILVRYRPDHDVFAEWVFNDADIDQSRIVWARELDPARNEALLSYFRNRKAWLLEPDQTPPRLSPYAGTSATADK